MEQRAILGDCREVLPTLPAGSFDLVLTDPPYPCIKRSYGTWTEEEWFALMNAVVPECRRVLKPTGSAVFILQPNSERVGKMRTWLWRFMADWGERWGIVQDAYWWNNTTLPGAHAIQGRLLRTSVKPCVWLGSPDCYRDQGAVLLPLSDRHKARTRQYAEVESSGRRPLPSGQGVDYARATKAAARRGGTTPFNLLPMHHGHGQRSAGSHGHGAGTPLEVCRWWIRYLCPPGGAVMDPFGGSGTVALAAKEEGRDAVSVERVPAYHEITLKRLAAPPPRPKPARKKAAAMPADLWGWAEGRKNGDGKD